jgi:hypothetical protein
MFNLLKRRIVALLIKLEAMDKHASLFPGNGNAEEKK